MSQWVTHRDPRCGPDPRASTPTGGRRARRGAAPVRLLPFGAGTAHLHRRAVRLDRGAARAGDAGAALAPTLAPGAVVRRSRSSRCARAAASDDAPPPRGPPRACAPSITRPGGRPTSWRARRPDPVAGDGADPGARARLRAQPRRPAAAPRQHPAPPDVSADVPGIEYAGEVAALGPGARAWRGATASSAWSAAAGTPSTWWCTSGRRCACPTRCRGPTRERYRRRS
jgi:hypothetical protein